MIRKYGDASYSEFTFCHLVDGIKGDDDTNEDGVGLDDTKALDDSYEPFKTSLG